MKKVIALVLALVMVLSLSTVAFADKKANSPKMVAANVIANALEVPATYLANFVLVNQKNIVNGLNVALPAAFYGLENSASVIDTAVQLGTKAAKVRVTVAAAPVVSAANVVAKVLDRIAGEADGEAKNNLSGMADDTRAFGAAVQAAADTVKKDLNNIASRTKELVEGFFNETIRVIVEELDDERHVKSPLGDMTIEQLIVPDEWEENELYEDYVTFMAAYEEAYDAQREALLAMDPMFAVKWNEMPLEERQKIESEWQKNALDRTEKAIKEETLKLNNMENIDLLKDNLVKILETKNDKFERFFDIAAGLSWISDKVNDLIPVIADEMKDQDNFADGDVVATFIYEKILKGSTGK